MKYLIMTVMVAASASLASAKNVATYQLNDKAIIGKYILQKADKKSEVQTAQIYFDTSYKLSLYVDGIEQDFEPQKPDASGLIGTVENEQIDCDHDDTACGYVESAKAYLLQTKDASGKAVPQLVVTAVESVYNEDQSTEDNPVYEDVTTTYTLIWSEELPHGGQPLYTFDKKVPAMDAYLKACKPLAAKFYEYPSDQVFCPQILIDDVTFGMDEGVQAAIGGWIKDPKTKKVTYEDLLSTFFKLPQDNIALAVSKKASAKTAGKLNDQVTKLQAFFKKKADDGAVFYYFTAEYGDQAWIVDAKTKSIFEFSYYKLNIH